MDLFSSYSTHLRKVRRGELACLFTGRVVTKIFWVVGYKCHYCQAGNWTSATWGKPDTVFASYYYLHRTENVSPSLPPIQSCLGPWKPMSLILQQGRGENRHPFGDSFHFCQDDRGAGDFPQLLLLENRRKIEP